jgi:hypothetical protein
MGWGIGCEQETLIYHFWRFHSTQYQNSSWRKPKNSRKAQEGMDRSHEKRHFHITNDMDLELRLCQVEPSWRQGLADRYCRLHGVPSSFLRNQHFERLWSKRNYLIKQLVYNQPLSTFSFLLSWETSFNKITWESIFFFVCKKSVN